MARHLSQPGRLETLDLARGLIMLLMALDHANALAGLDTLGSGEFWDGQFPDYASLSAYLTRAVSHICAPGFALLMGSGMALLAGNMRRAGAGTATVAGRFALRGAILLVLQFTLENWAWRLGMDFPYGGGIYVGVLAMLGASMILAGPLTGLGAGVLAMLALGAMALGWHLVPPVAEWRRIEPVWLRLVALPGGSGQTLVLFPLLPWFGVVLAGVAMGRLLQRYAKAVLRGLPWAGLALLLLFALLRTHGGTLANLRPLPGWSADHWWPFFYGVKYPPSPAFLSLTLGAFLLCTGLLHHAAGRAPRVVRSILLAMGRSALPFYVLHLWLYAGLGWLVAPGVGLAGVYAVWLAGLAALVPACMAWVRFKGARPADSAWRLL